METTTEIVTPEWKESSTGHHIFGLHRFLSTNQHLIIKDLENNIALECYTGTSVRGLHKVKGYAYINNQGNIMQVSNLVFSEKQKALQKLTIINSKSASPVEAIYHHDKQLKEHQEAIKELQSTIDTIKYQNKHLFETIVALSRRISGLEEEVQELQPEVFMTPLGQQVKDVSNVGTNTDTAVCTSVETQVQNPGETQVHKPVETKKSSTEHGSSYVVEDSSMVVVTTEPRKATWYKVFGDY